MRQIYLKYKVIKEYNEKYNRRKIVAKRNYLTKLYRACQKNIITRWYINKISNNFQVLYPGEDQFIIGQTMKTAVNLWSLSILLIICMFLYFKSFYIIWTVSFYIVVIHIELVSATIKSQEIRLLIEFEKYLTDVRHNYYISHMVEDSLEYATEQKSRQMRIHGVKIYNIITSDDPEKGFQAYNDTGPNKYLRLFLALSIKVIEYGDQIVDGQSLYLSNINNLKNDVHIELLKIKNIKFAFTGLSFLAVIPILFLIPIRNWCVSNIPELANFYDLSKGKLLAVLIHITAFIAYFMLIHLKDARQIIIERNPLLDKIGKISFIKNLINNYVNKFYTKVLYLELVLKESGESIKVKEFISKRFIYAFLAFVLSLAYFIYLNILEDRALIYWYQLLISSGFGFAAYGYPYMMVKYKSKIMKMNMEDEVVQFQSIIMMVKDMDRISIITILEFMENFATIFKDSIQACINDFDAGDIQALEELRDNERFEPFRRIVNGLIISDKIGIEKAFDEIATDQSFYQDKRKSDNEEILSMKTVIGKVIANTPVIITVGLYLIVPFVSESLNQLSGFTKEWNLF